MNATKIKTNEAYRVVLKKYPDVLNIKQMCEIFGISEKTGYKLLQENKIRSLKIGRSYRIPKVHLIHYLNMGYT